MKGSFRSNERWSHLLDFDHTHLLSSANLERYARAIHERGAPVCSQAYNGHKKFHALKFQAVMLPNGMFGHLFGPLEGRRNDNFLLSESGLLEKCIRYAVRTDTDEITPAEQRFLQIFSDPAYGISNQLLSPFVGPGERTTEERDWNAAMASVRIEVEHGFGIVANLWPYLNAGWKMRVYASPVGRYYRVGVLLTNVLTCLHGNHISQYFDCQPPELRDYLHN